MHPRSSCSHASVGSAPARVVCALRILPDDSHVGGCAGCDKNTDSFPVKKVWPKWAEAIAKAQSPADAGVGDSAAREIERLGQEEFQRVYGITFGPECACQAKEWGPEARAGWNARYPYEKQPLPERNE